jgi:uncharacterized membrane protein (UPF0127 family)
VKGPNGVLTARNADTGVLVARRVQIAATHAARAVGLLGRARLDGGEGLLIVPCHGVHTWGMRFPIDVLALDLDGVVVDCVSALRPWRIRLPRRRAASVLELPAGTIAFTTTHVGDRIVLEPVVGSWSGSGGPSAGPPAGGP